MVAKLARSGVWGFVCLAILWAVIAWPWLSGEVTIPYDAKAHFQAQLQFLANALHRGDSPFWTPNIFGGSPQIADPQSLIFSPAFLLALLDAAPSFRAMDAYVLGTLLLGAFAIAQHGRERGWTLAAQIIAGLVFAFGASSAWRLQHVGQVQSLACFAVAFWLLARALERRSWRSGLAAGVAAGVMLVKPDQVAFLGAWVLAAHVVWFLLKDRRPLAAARAAAPALAAGGAAGLAIILVPLLMTLFFAESSSRPEIAFSEAARGSLHPAYLLTAVVADLFGALDPKVEFWGPSSAAWAPGSLSLSQNMGQIYVGALPLLAIAVWIGACWRGIRGEALFLLGALAAMVLYALGAFTPAYALIFDWVPGASLFRRPADATFLIGALLALLSGHALTALGAQAGRNGLLRPTLFVAALAAALLALGAVFAASHGVLRQAAPAIGLAGLWLGLGIVALGVIARTGQGRPGPAMIAALGVAALLAADLRINNGPNESTALPPAAYAVMEPNTENDTITYLKRLLARNAAEPARRDRVDLMAAGFHWPNLGMVHGFDTVFGYNPLHGSDYSEATGARDHMGTPMDRRLSFTPLFPSYRSTFVDMLGVRYILSDAPIERVDGSLKPADLRLLARTRDGFVYENANALPRAMFVSAWKIADFDMLRESGLPQDFDPRSTVLLERPIEDTPFVAPDASRCAKAKVRLVSYANTEVVISVDAPAAGFVVLNDVWHPWWQATVNGEEVDVLKANVLFRAVQVEAGTSVIRFRFRPLDGLVAQLRERLMGPDEDDEALLRTP
jgi:hypothetical protein